MYSLCVVRVARYEFGWWVYWIIDQGGQGTLVVIVIFIL